MGDAEKKTGHIGRCGYYCCALCAYHTGELVDAAKRLRKMVDSYKSLRLIAQAGNACDFDRFVEGLVWLASQEQPCRGCRLGGGWSWWGDCPVRTCTIAKRVDFCYECREFPCQALETGPLKEYLQRFVEANRQMKRIGLEKWAKQRWGRKLD